MAIKSILVHLASDEQHGARLAAGVELARRHGAHLIALYVAAPVHLPASATGRGASAAFIAEATEIARERSTAIKAETESRCQQAGISWEWAYGEENHFDRIMEEVYRADLTILRQVAFDDLEDYFLLELPEKVTLGAAGPVLMLPKTFDPREIDKPDQHILVAWKNSRQAARAVRDSMPLLRVAKTVTVLHCGPDETSVGRLIEYLGHHGVDAQLRHDRSEDDVGKIIIDTAREIGADVVVMGAYGRSKLREALFGGPTRYVLTHTPLPLLLSH